MYGLIISIAILFSVLVAEKLTPPNKRDILWQGAFWSILGGIVGARIYHVFSMWGFYSQNPTKIIEIWNGGLGIWGAITGGILVGSLFLTLKKEKLADWLGIGGVALPLGQSIGRWGNFFNKELYGLPTHASWGVFVEPQNRPTQYADQRYFHPLFLYESILNLTTFLICLALYKKLPPGKKWQTIPLYLALYSVTRFFLEYLRINTDQWLWNGWNISQCIALATLLISALVLLVQKKA